MAFWSKERLVSEHATRPIIVPYDERRIEQCAYALGVAAEYAITSTEDGGAKKTVTPGGHITIPPGQFAVLLTEERITVPTNALALISMKAKFKLRGLMNVSGFHVDPGFSGRLKFAVYNAGASAIDLKPGQPLFLIWYSELDQETQAVYNGGHQSQDSISADDVMSIRGIVMSPAGIDSRLSSVEKELKSELRKIENKIDTHQNWTRPILTGLVVGLVVGIVVFVLNRIFQPAPQPTASSIPVREAPSQTSTISPLSQVTPVLPAATSVPQPSTPATPATPATNGAPAKVPAR